jgi:cell wall assembly regulator SMI1
MTAEQFWIILHAWFDNHCPSMLDCLNPPATETEIGQLQMAIGHEFPKEFWASYLIHDGSDANSGPIAGLPLMSLAEIRTTWESWVEIASYDDDDLDEPCQSEPANAIQLKYAHAGWLPFCGDSQNFVSIDFAPGKAGKFGQVINTGRDDEIRHVIADDIGGFFGFVARQFASGRISVIESEDEPPRWLAVNESADLLTALPDLLMAR